MVKRDRNVPPKYRFSIFHRIRNKLLVLMIVLSLFPLAGMSTYSYFVGRNLIQERIRLSLEKMAQDTADKVDLLLRGKKEEIHLMATSFSLIYNRLDRGDRKSLIPLLNNYCFQQDVYDLLIVLNSSGDIIGINTIDRDGDPLAVHVISKLVGGSITPFPEEYKLFQSSVTGHNDHNGWYQSRLVQSIYDYKNEDICHQYNIAFSEPIIDPETHEIVGVWINILNWSYFQNILDPVETDLSNLGLRTGYAFMTANDANTIIAHKYRLHRVNTGHETGSQALNFYNTKLLENRNLRPLYEAILNQKRNFIYGLPGGDKKIVGLAPIGDTSLGWIIGVEIDEQDVYQPIHALTYWLFVAVFVLSLLVIFSTYIISRGITVPLNTLTRSAITISQGNFNDRVPVQSSDELGVLATTFNEMARTLSSRETQLQELNRNLENIVRDRTLELENSHEALKRAYFDLKSAQEQLVQTEKMASLGQLVAGIAHEIKNPLNFIYGNTGFLEDYTQKIQGLLEACEKLPSISAEDRAAIERMKEEVHYAFIKQDLKILIDNFRDGSSRINAIVSDLRAFSRMDRDTVSEVDLHASLEMSLNLLRNQYKDRIEIHKDYGQIPQIKGYPGKLNQVFMNLLSNAFYAVKDRGSVWIKTRSVSDAVEIEITDSGAGIPQKDIKRIFEPFFTTKPVGQGTGLGLSISYGIIEQHRGKIQVASSPEKGTVFTIQLPIDMEKA